MTARDSLLLVDDDEDLLALLRIRLEDAGYRVLTTTDPKRADALILDEHPGMVITDLRMPGVDGLTLLNRLRARYPSLPVVLMTAHGTIPDAVQATREGAFAFVTKPIDTRALLDTISQAMASSCATPLAAEASASDVPLVAQAPAMQRLLARVRKVAPSAATVMVRGPTGTGKDRIAQLLHHLGACPDGPFVPVNCGAIPESLFEAELFGHARGAFTNAGQARAGLMAAAHGGTLFLDEIGDLPLSMQVKLLRALETGEVRPVGSDRSQAVDLRLVAATNVDLCQAVADGRFREDLFYRLNVVTLELPPLKDRPEDIPPLVAQFLGELSDDADKARVYAPEAMALLVAAPWPGNVRQLRNVVVQNVALSAAPVITAAEVRYALGEQTPAPPKPFDEARDDFTRDYLLALLRMTGGNVSRAARLARRNRTDFYKLLGRSGIELPSRA
jgi:two-component system response regulator GlrR